MMWFKNGGSCGFCLTEWSGGQCHKSAPPVSHYESPVRLNEMCRGEKM